MSTERPKSPDAVQIIDLTEDSPVKQPPKPSAPIRATSVKSEPLRERGNSDKTPQEDASGGGKVGAVHVKQEGRARIHTTTYSSDDDVLVVEATAAAPTLLPSTDNDDDDVAMVGVANETRLPHLRHDCTKHKFTQDAVDSYKRHKALMGYRLETSRSLDSEAVEANKAFCDLCYCYVCDKPASECNKWQKSENPTYSDHCHASCRGEDSHRWKQLRTANKQGISSTQDDVPMDLRGWLGLPSHQLTKCRKCGHENLFHLNKYPKRRHPVGYLDWCHQCGRVASDDFFGKVQSKPYVPTPGQFTIGTRVVGFKIRAHDPREMEPYRENWENADSTQPAWTWDPAEMEEDVFRHRIGPRPELCMITKSIPVLTVDKIPKTGSFRRRVPHNRWGPPSPPSYYYEKEDWDGENVSPDETDAIILDKSSDLYLLYELEKTLGNYGSFNICAKWDEQSRTGELTIEVFLKEREQPKNLSRFLLSWLDIAPFSLAEVGRSIKARENEALELPEEIPVPPFTVHHSGEEYDFLVQVKDKRDKAIKEHNDVVNAYRSNLSLVSGDGPPDSVGGVCSNETDLRGVLRSYFQELLEESQYTPPNRNMWFEEGLGVVHQYRDMVSGGRYSDECFLPIDTQPYIRREDFPLAAEDLDRKDDDDSGSIQWLMDHLVNLGHSAVPFVEGLTVDLLEFQRQSVQWALERETCTGGVQSFLWPKLPSVDGISNELYFSPVLERIRSDKPKLVRGGIIAEEMGLGKTVISLALILQNPAPQLPVSGSPVTSINVANTAEGQQDSWDKDLYALTSKSNSKRGSILSRGTLVVCPVSLVGQWIDEARSKLKDPGLVYPYHGQGRNRNPMVLASNSIVVTTYQVLASDATYHARKAGAGYCAPLEQVRWWRIICDEGHSMKGPSTLKGAALNDLVADHKWVVTGTPISTSVNDLRNQLKFIGLENVDEMFNIFRMAVFPHFRDRGQSSRMHASSDDRRKLGHFLFLMRKIMIRHKQNQKYRGTSTTLMSLPKKTERVMEIEWEGTEVGEYQKEEDAARAFYIAFKNAHGHALSQHYLKLTQQLVPMRVACSGGRIQLNGEENEDGKPGDQEDSSTSMEPPKKKAKKEVRYSETFFRSKFNALIQELVRIRDNDSSAKSLVFSQFTSTLRFLQEELPKHGFQYRTLSGDMTMKKRAEALHEFQNDPPTTIFLLSMRAGAVGINLTQANRVFLMEPSFNPALEAQAIGRVHRLGQKRSVEIVRLIMKDSVESRLVKMLKNKYGDSNTSGAHKDSKKDGGTGFIGSLKNDRTTVLSDEFDLLYGVPISSPTEEPASEEEEALAASMDTSAWL